MRHFHPSRSAFESCVTSFRTHDNSEREKKGKREVESNGVYAFVPRSSLPINHSCLVPPKNLVTAKAYTIQPPHPHHPPFLLFRASGAHRFKGCTKALKVAIYHFIVPVVYLYSSCSSPIECDDGAFLLFQGDASRFHKRSLITSKYLCIHCIVS